MATGLVACWLSAGIVFGFAALKPALIAEGIYSDLCESDYVIGISNSKKNPRNILRRARSTLSPFLRRRLCDRKCVVALGWLGS